MYPDPPTTAARYAIAAVYTHLHIYATRYPARRMLAPAPPAPAARRLRGFARVDVAHRCTRQTSGRFSSRVHATVTRVAESMPAVQAEGLVKRFGDDRGPARRRPHRGAGDRARRARPQRRGQDHRGAHPHHAAPPDAGRALHRRHRRRRRSPTRPGPHRPHRPVRRGRRTAHRLREPRARRAAVPPAAARRPPSAPASCSSASTSPTPPTAAPAPTRAACAGASTSP